MIWATVISLSCFCWLYRASPSLAAKNIINLILVLTIWWCPCVESSLVVLEEGVCYDQSILLAKLYYPLPWFILYSKAKFACYSRYFLTSYFYIPIPYNGKDIFLGVLVLEGLVGPHRTIQLQLLRFQWSGHRHGLLWYWTVCLGNEQRSFCCFWDCLRWHPSTDSFVNYDGYSISSKEFLPTIVDIVVIWIKFTHSCIFLRCRCSIMLYLSWPHPIYLDSWT